MKDSRVAPTKEFSLEDARRVLPLVSAIVADFAELQQRVRDRETRLSGLVGGRDLARHDPYSEELRQMQRDVESDKARVKEYLDELRALGVVPDEADPAIVRFPSHREEEPIWLCWRLGEADVAHWSPRKGTGTEWNPLTKPDNPK